MFPSLPIPRLQATVEEQLEETKQELEEAKEKIEDQEFAMEVDQEEITRLKDRDRKRAKLLADNAEAKRMAVEKVRDAEKEKWEAKLNERKAQLESELTERTQKIDSEYKDTFEKQRKSVNVAHAEKRAAWTRIAEANRKAKRLAKELEKGTERMETESESEDTDDESEEEDPTRRLTFELLPRRDEAGRFQAEAPELRALRWAQLARGVAQSTVSHNIADVVELLCPGLELPAVDESTSKRMRTEVTLAGEAMAAWKFAASNRVLSFGWDESTKFGNGVFGVNAQIENKDGTIEDICLRGLSILPEGGKSAALLDHIEKHILSYSRDRLTQWMQTFEKVNGAGSWVQVGGPSPDNIGLHRLAEDTVLMTDTCNGARCTKRMLAEAVMRTIREKVGEAAWAAMSDEERDRKYKVYRGDCWQHLRNIMIDAMAAKGDEIVKEKLRDDLAEFSAYERIEPEGGSIIRSSFKQFSAGGEYAKGRGREFRAYHVKYHPTALFIDFERALGSRMDLKFDGCVPLFLNRLICLEFLRGYIECPKSENVLDRSLYTVLRCNEVVALLRANSLWKYIFSEPFRWLTGKSTKIKGWSLFKMSWVLDLVEKAMIEIAADPKRALNPNLDIFGPVAAEVPELKEWCDEQLARKVKAADGKTEYFLVKEVLRRARSPAEGSGEQQATAVTLEIIQAQAQRCIEKMHDKKIALADKLESQQGPNSYASNHNGHERTKGAHVNNDAVENKFATADYVMRTFRYMSVVNVSGCVQQRTAHDFDQPLRIVSDRRKRKATAAAQEEAETQRVGFFWRLTKELRHALVEMARRDAAGTRQAARKDQQAHDEEKLARREEALQRQLNSAVDRYAQALELYDQWVAQGARDRKQLDAALKGKSTTEKLAELRRQIEMRTLGCGWTHFKVKWGFDPDEKEETIKAWRKQLLDEIIPHEMTLRRQKRLPAAAAPPQVCSRITKVLGTTDTGALQLEAQGLFNVAGLLERAQVERARREAAGISDGVEAKQQAKAPLFNTELVGKWLEVCWPYKGGDGKTVKIWASGQVKRVADGLTDKRSARAKKILPAGALLWAWEADPEYKEASGEQWLVLLPEKWNKHVQYAWRFDPCELVSQGSAVPPPRAPCIDSEPEEEEFLAWDDHIECEDEDESWIRRI